MFYFVQLLVFLLITVSLAILTTGLGAFDSRGRHAYRINQLWAWLLLRIGGISLEVRGLENVDPSRPYVFMVNHQSNVDIPVLIQSLCRFQLRWIAKKELLRVPLVGWAMWATKHITVNRSDPSDAVKSLERAKKHLAAGLSIVIFPEGTRSHDGTLLRFKKGGFLLALQSRTSIVPVTIRGSGRVLPAGDWRLRSGRIAVFIGKPIHLEDYRVGNLRALSEEVRRAIAGPLDQSAPPNSEIAPAGPEHVEKRSA